MKIVILGPQGSGKGTQAELLAKDYNILHISTGDIFRENMKNDTDLGKRAKSYINNGQLVPDDVVTNMIKSRLSEDDVKDGWILDGFPRNINQFNELIVFNKPDVAVDIEITDDEVIQRISGRLVCKTCGKGYHKIYLKPKVEGKCDVDQGELIHRQDDTPEVILKRLKIYHEETSPLIDAFKKEGILKIVNGSQDIEHVLHDIKVSIERNL